MTQSILVSGKFLGDPLTGVQRHAWEIIRRLLAAKFPLSLIVPEALQIHASYEPVPTAGLMRRGKGRGHVWQQLVLPRKIDRSAILWTPSGLGSVAVNQQVLTVHDLSFLDHPEWFSKTYSFVYRLLLPLVMRRALHIITSSTFSQQRISERLHIALDRISVIPCAVSATLAARPSTPQDEQKIRDQYNLPELYILALGSIEPRKNLQGLIKALQLLQPNHPTLRLVLVGGRAGIYGNVDFPAEIADVVHQLGYVPNEHLSTIYRSARVFVYPSLYEGFGMPPLEAMACGAPVITSNTTSLPEVVGNAALTVPPTDIPALAAAIERVLQDPALRQQLIQSGYERVSQFSWDHSAQQSAALLQRLRERTGK
ncbi:MAG: glycosyltransferase family 4 protein [Chloroflexota bacterium]|nr:glycosyltransferase family 4 protein [Chloroflexota bacterium]